MIFVSVGTHEAPFDRMLATIYELELDEPLVVQYGINDSVRTGARSGVPVIRRGRWLHSAVTRRRHARRRRLRDGLARQRQAADRDGSQHRFGEHVDDHQLELARRLEAAGLVTAVDDAAALSAALAAESTPPGSMRDVPWLGDDLGGYLAQQLGAPTPVTPGRPSELSPS